MIQKSEMSSEAIERLVLDHLSTLLQEYLHMDELADEMLSLQQQSKSIDGQMDRLRSSREQIMELENNAASIMKQYREICKKSSPEVSQMTKQIQERIEKMLVKIAALEKSTHASYRQLLPEIDQGVRGNQMKQAYGKSNL